jgi:hypothetical protein
MQELAISAPEVGNAKNKPLGIVFRGVYGGYCTEKDPASFFLAFGSLKTQNLSSTVVSCSSYAFPSDDSNDFPTRSDPAFLVFPKTQPNSSNSCKSLLLPAGSEVAGAPRAPARLPAVPATQ